MKPQLAPMIGRIGVFVAASIALAACGTTASQGPATTSGTSGNTTRAAHSGAPATGQAPRVTISGPAVCATLAQATREFAGTPAGSTPTALANAYANLRVHEPAVEHAAPASIRGDFHTLFNVLNNFYGTLATVGYDYRKLSAAEAARLAASTRGLAPAAAAIQAYLTKNCTAPVAKRG